MDIVNQIRKASELINRLPPAPRGILKDWRVPMGKAFKQYDTSGDLWVWVNDLDIDFIPKQKPTKSLFGRSIAHFGIPIYQGHPYWRQNEYRAAS